MISQICFRFFSNYSTNFYHQWLNWHPIRLVTSLFFNFRSQQGSPNRRSLTRSEHPCFGVPIVPVWAHKKSISSNYFGNSSFTVRNLDPGMVNFSFLDRVGNEWAVQMLKGFAHVREFEKMMMSGFLTV